MFSIVVMLLACEPSSDVPVVPTSPTNPTGSCEADSDGSRPCYHAPGESWYLPHCEPVLDRELWRVFAESEDSAYMIPRPDATGLDYGICDGEDAVLSDIFERNGLCEATVGPEQLEVINAMPLVDALDIAHALHERLEFTALALDETSWDISPWAPYDDRVAACNATSDPTLDDICDELESFFANDACPNVVVLYSSQTEASAMASALNALYGID